MKKVRVLLGGAFLCMLLAFATNTTKVEAAKMKLNKSKTTIFIGKTEKLQVKNTKKKVKWSTADKKVAAVTKKGVVTGKKEGKTTVTATVGKKKLKCKVTVQRVLLADKTAVSMKKNDTAKVKITFKQRGTIYWKTADKSIATAKWRGFKGNENVLTITGHKPGTTTITITNTVNNEKIKIKVVVNGPWDGVKVIIPSTIGDDGSPENRMKILNYSFYGDYTNYYYMNIKMQLVKYGRELRNWGTYFYCYDKDGAILKSCFLYANGLRLNGVFFDDVMIPVGTATIEFIEYPDGSDTGSGSGGGAGEEEQEPTEPETDPMKWTYSEIEKLYDYSDQAYKYVDQAKSAIDKGIIYASVAVGYLEMAQGQLKNAKVLMDSNYDLMFTDGTTLAQKLDEALADFEVLEGIASEDVEMTAYSLAVTTAAFRTLIAKVRVEIYG